MDCILILNTAEPRKLEPSKTRIPRKVEHNFTYMKTSKTRIALPRKLEHNLAYKKSKKNLKYSHLNTQLVQFVL